VAISIKREIVGLLLGSYGDGFFGTPVDSLEGSLVLIALDVLD
jgi:hypothetical protein